MNFSPYILGTSLIVFVSTTQPQPVLALEATQINEIAQKITVRINANNDNEHGSGVIIAREGSTYYVLTSKHVVEYLDYEYTVLAPDADSYLLNNSTINHIDGIDLAVISFESDSQL